ncbi:exocyst complex component, sec15 subunit [Phellopilus nigrolimitatus]|nr:exocyst complex component, sec15 subunit [Phellopilus nigrolimitatus]
MPPRRRVQHTQDSIDQQLQQIHLLDPSSSSENLEQLGPIIKQIYVNRQQEAFLRTLQGLVQSKEADIEKICADNYQDFISSVSTLFTIKSYTTNLRDKISTLDSNVTQVGRGLVEKKKALLQTKKTAANLDEAIDNLQACLKVLDVVDRVGEMINDGKYWTALRSLEEVHTMPPASLSQTPLFQHLMSSLPSLRAQIKDAVTASTKQWLLMIRNSSGQVGKLAIDSMELRTRKWRVRREKDASLKHSRIGSAVEAVSNEKVEYNVFDNDRLKVDFKPLYQCIHIYTALESLEELQKSYQADRKAQSDLILPSPLILASLSSLTQEITVLRTTRNFRSERNIDELWVSVVGRLTQAIELSLNNETDPEVFLMVKECLLAFIVTLETYSYTATQVQTFILVLFEKYTTLLENQFKSRFEGDVQRDDNTPMRVSEENGRNAALKDVWLARKEFSELINSPLPLTLPWSQCFPQSCEDIRNFVKRFYLFMDGVSQHHRNIDELLGKSLDRLLANHVSQPLQSRLPGISTLSQIAQIIANLEHFEIACSELEKSLTSLRSAQRGGTIRLTAGASFSETIKSATARISAVIASKLDDFFELADYDWTPKTREDAPSMYLYELAHWLATVVDSLVVQNAYKDEAYKAAVQYIADCLMDFITGPNVPMLNDNALSNIAVDVGFLEGEFKNVGREHVNVAFAELRLMTSIPLSDKVQEYLVPSIRQTTYSIIKPKKFQALLEKLAKFGGSSRDSAERERGEKRRKEADAVGRIFPGESRH